MQAVEPHIERHLDAGADADLTSSRVGGMFVDASEHVGSQACGSTSLSLAVMISVDMAARPVSAALGTGEEPRLLAQRHHPFILPMSGRS